jgi:hypothetical protein
VSQFHFEWATLPLLQLLGEVHHSTFSPISREKKYIKNNVCLDISTKFASQKFEDKKCYFFIKVPFFTLKVIVEVNQLINKLLVLTKQLDCKFKQWFCMYSYAGQVKNVSQWWNLWVSQHLIYLIGSEVNYLLLSSFR